MLRPSLCLLACEAVGGEWRRALPAAAALELVHNFSLAHDDIEDSSLERRGRSTIWCLWGQPQAINAGDAMFVLSHLALLRLIDRGIEPAKVVRAAYLLDEACLKLCEGQYLDLCYEARLDIDVDDYLKMIEGKTAALFECSLKLGALLGTEEQAAIEHLGNFGHNLGLSFQIQDDILGIWGEEKITGKSSTSDIQQGKKTLPIIYGLNQGEELSLIYEKGINSQSEAFKVMAILDNIGARGYAQDMSHRFYRQAVYQLDSAPISQEAKEELRTIADFILQREY
jgi:geranylgeranyl diphosphate synthase type I